MTQGGEDAGGDSDQRGQNERCGAESGGNRKGVGEEVADGKIAPAKARTEIAVRQAGEIVKILSPDRLVEAIEPPQVLHHARIERVFEIEWSARRDADQKKGDRDHREQGRGGVESALGDIAFQNMRFSLGFAPEGPRGAKVWRTRRESRAQSIIVWNDGPNAPGNEAVKGAKRRYAVKTLDSLFS